MNGQQPEPIAQIVVTLFDNGSVKVGIGGNQISRDAIRLSMQVAAAQLEMRVLQEEQAQKVQAVPARVLEGLN